MAHKRLALIGIDKMKTIGTLEEIGAQVGDVVECIEWNGCIRASGDIINIDGSESKYAGLWRIISRAAKSPVRTVTRK